MPNRSRAEWPRHYVLDDAGEPVPASLLQWADWFQTADRHVAEDLVGDVRVSTVFLGLDSNFHDDGPAVLWESMVFGGALDGEGDRYTSRAAAIAGHAEILARVYAAAPPPAKEP